MIRQEVKGSRDTFLRSSCESLKMICASWLECHRTRPMLHASRSGYTLSISEAVELASLGDEQKCILSFHWQVVIARFTP